MKPSLLLRLAIFIPVSAALTMTVYRLAGSSEDERRPAPAVTAVPSPSPSILPTPSVLPSPSPSASPSPSPTPSPTPTPTPSATPTPSPTPATTPRPEVLLELEQTSVTTVGGKEVSVKITTQAGASVTAQCTEGISTWYDPGILYIYPSKAGTVTVTASAPDYQPVSGTITVLWSDPTPAPTPTPSNTPEPVQTPVPEPAQTPEPAPQGGSSGTGYTSDYDSTLYVPTVSRNDDMSFWFRSCMVDMKDQFFDTAESYGVDPYLALAISDQETGYGTSTAACEQNNYGGLIGSQGVITFDTPQDGLNALMNTLRNYKNAGKRTIYDIAQWYCGGNEHWIQRITTIYNSFHQ